MARTILIVATLFILTGCPNSPSTTTLTAEQIATYQAELKQAQVSKSFWQTTALVLAALVILALVSGAVLGSKAKDDADGK